MLFWFILLVVLVVILMKASSETFVAHYSCSDDGYRHGHRRRYEHRHGYGHKVNLRNPYFNYSSEFCSTQ
jgi:hypothetical protein